MPDLPPLPWDARVIMDYLPHRYPFLLVDRVTVLEPGNCIEAYKCVSSNEPYFTGHFPGNPVMPGVLQIECIAQTGAILCMSMPELQGKLPMLTSTNHFKFRRPVVPGDILRIRVDDFCYRVKHGIGKAHGTGTVDGKVTVEGEVGFAIIDVNNQ
jgi:3-hydroxyacyl-[acyl-carrier-protein] dehydratase